MVDFRIVDGELVVIEGDVERFRGLPDGLPPDKVVPVPDSHDAIVLLRARLPEGPCHAANLIRLAPDGEIRWRAMPPECEEGTEDAWIAVRWEKAHGLSANSWSCFHCRLDAETGEIASAVFGK